MAATSAPLAPVNGGRHRLSSTASSLGLAERRTAILATPRPLSPLPERPPMSAGTWLAMPMDMVANFQQSEGRPPTPPPLPLSMTVGVEPLHAKMLPAILGTTSVLSVLPAVGSRNLPPSPELTPPENAPCRVATLGRPSLTIRTSAWDHSLIAVDGSSSSLNATLPSSSSSPSSSKWKSKGSPMTFSGM